MAWNTPRAWASLELVTAGNMNTFLSDLLAYLKGSAGAVTIDQSLTVSGTLTSTGPGVFSNASAAVLGNTIAMRDGNGYLYAAYFNAAAQDVGAGIPTKIAGQNGDNYYRWYNETNWLRTGNAGEVDIVGSVDLGRAADPQNARRLRFVHAAGGAVTVTCSNSAGIVVGTSVVSSTVIANGDSYGFYAKDNNYWMVV